MAEHCTPEKNTYPQKKTKTYQQNFDKKNIYNQLLMIYWKKYHVNNFAQRKPVDKTLIKLWISCVVVHHC